jgi:hypothetical protein
MSRTELLVRVEHAERQVVLAQSLIDAQRLLVLSLRSAGTGAASAQKTLDELERAQDARLAEIDALLDQLDKIPMGEEEAEAAARRQNTS